MTVAKSTVCLHCPSIVEQRCFRQQYAVWMQSEYLKVEYKLHVDDQYLHGL